MVSSKRWLLVLLVVAGQGAIARRVSVAQQFNTGDSKPSVTESISSGFQRGVDKLSRWVKPKPAAQSADDAISLTSKMKPSAKTHTAIGRLHEKSGKLTDAAKSYRKALDLTPNYLGALLGLARVECSTDKPDEAMKLYRRAMKAHPREASVYNNLGAFHGSRGDFDQAIAALNRAIELRPKQTNYRANIAVVLVHLGRTREAFSHLQAVHGEAVAYYNVGFLLKSEGQAGAAAHHFAMALQADPSMNEAKYWMSQLKAAQMHARRPTGRPQGNPLLGRPPARPPKPSLPGTPRQDVGPSAAVRQLPPPPRRPSQNVAGRNPSRAAELFPNGVPPMLVPKRLPPTEAESPPKFESAPLPTGPYGRKPISAAPLPTTGIKGSGPYLAR